MKFPEHIIVYWDEDEKAHYMGDVSEAPVEVIEDVRMGLTEESTVRIYRKEAVRCPRLKN